MSTSTSESGNGIWQWCEPRLGIPFTAGGRSVSATVNVPAPYQVAIIEELMRSEEDRTTNPEFPRRTLSGQIRRYVDIGRSLNMVVAIYGSNPDRNLEISTRAMEMLCAPARTAAAPSLFPDRPSSLLVEDIRAARARLNQMRGLPNQGMIASMMNEMFASLGVPRDIFDERSVLNPGIRQVESVSRGPAVDAEGRQEVHPDVAVRGPARRRVRHERNLGGFGSLMDTEPGQDRVGSGRCCAGCMRANFEMAEFNRNLQYGDEPPVTEMLLLEDAK